MIKAARILFVLCLILGLAHEVLAKDMFEEEVDKEALSVKLARETVSGGYALVTTAELSAMLKENKPMLIVDSMPFADSFKKEHVPGAVNFEFPIEPMPVWDASKTAGQSEEDYAKLLGPDKNKLVVVYCGFVKCGRSHNAALWAKKLGYANVVRYSGGIYAWKGAQNPVEAVKD